MSAIDEPEPMNRPEIDDRLDDALNRLPELDRNLALLRWAEIDPEGAFRFGNARDQEQGGYSLGDTAETRLLGLLKQVRSR